MPTIAETPRLKIRTWELDDVEALCELTRQEGLAEFSTSGYANFSAEQSRHWIQKEKERFAQFRLAKFAVILRAENVPIGISGLFQMPPPLENSVELNYRFPRHRRGQGYAFETANAVLDYGFRELKLECINANVDVRNEISMRLLKKLRMEKIGDTSYEGIAAYRFSISAEAHSRR